MMRSKLPKPNTCIVCTIHFRTDEEKKHPVELMSLKILNMSDNVGIFYPDTVERLKKVQLFKNTNAVIILPGHLMGCLLCKKYFPS